MDDRRRTSAIATGRQEHGVALLALLAVVVLGAALALLAMSNKRPLELDREKTTSRALAKAKEALIAYAATYSDTHPSQVPGYLPCPDQAGGNPEGVAETNCGVKDATVIGRLPWRTLGMEPPRDGAGECLWYAVSGAFKNNPKTELMNWDTLGQIEVYGGDGATHLAGSQPENRAAAVIFAPGVALGQERQDDDPGTTRIAVCSEDYVPPRFLETLGAINNAAPNDTAGAITKFVAGDKSDVFNDRLLFVTPEDIFSAIEKRSDFAPKLASLVQSAAVCLTEYVKSNTNYASGDRRFPWTAPVALSAYTADGYWDDAADSLSGRLPYSVDTTQATVANSTPLARMMETAGCLLRADNPPSWSIGPDHYWWENWKDHLFYALGTESKPTTPTPSPTACGAGCLRVNGTGGQVAVVMFAGKRLTGQVRSTDTANGTLGNYLEGRNLTNHSSGDTDYEQIDPSTSAFNDLLWCVKLTGSPAAGIPIAAPCIP
jgi:hypothetical protein